MSIILETHSNCFMIADMASTIRSMRRIPIRRSIFPLRFVSLVTLVSLVSVVSPRFLCIVQAALSPLVAHPKATPVAIRPVGEGLSPIKEGASFASGNVSDQVLVAPLKYVSSTRQESVVTFRWGHQRFSSSEAYRWTRAKDGRIVNLQSPFQHDYFQVSIAERILAEAPTNAQEHDICLEMTPFEQMLWLHDWESSTFERSHYG